MSELKGWEEEIKEIMDKDVSDMDYDELSKLTLAFRDDDEVERWSEKGDDYYETMEETYTNKYGIAYPIKDDAPDKVKKAYERLSEMELNAAKEGIILG